MHDPLLYTIQEAATLLNIKVSRLRTAIFRREIGHVKFSGLIRFTRADLEAWISKAHVRPSARIEP